jgi:chromosome partitioning protein
MTAVITIASQKGGVGKSTLARLLASEYTRNEWTCRIADLDLSQTTSKNWSRRRASGGHEPSVRVEEFASPAKAMATAREVDLLILDMPPHASQMVVDAARLSHVVLFPTGTAIDDLEPQLELAKSLHRHGIAKSRMAFVFVKVLDNPGTIADARDLLAGAGFTVIEGAVPLRTAYERTTDEGRALTEVPFPSLRAKALELAENLAAFINLNLEKPDEQLRQA